MQGSLDEALTALERIATADWQTAGQHPTRGAMTIQQVVDTFMVSHLDAHIEQIRRAVGYSPSQVP
jgi:hypothetical protein